MQQTSIRTKLFVCFGFVSLAAAGAAVYSLATIRHIRSQMTEEIVGGAARLDQARQITIGLANMRIAMRGVSLFATMQKPEQVTKARSLYNASAVEMHKTIQLMEEGAASPEDRAAINAIRSALDQWVERFQEFADQSAAGHPIEASDAALKTTTPLMDTLQKNAAAFGQANSARRDAAIVAAEASIQRNELFMTVFTALVLLAGGGGALVVTGLAKTLKQVAGSLVTGANQVAQAAAQVSSSSQSLAQASSENASSLEETSASTEQINSMAARNTENARGAAGIVTQSTEKFATTNQALDDMVVSMNEINGSSQKISKIIKVIDEIAFQTNILALNAAVEAARAGEAGMGFAVVADEVRNLAQRCAQAARDTASLIEESIAKSNDGKSKVDRVAEAIRGVSAEAEQIKRLVDEVHLGSQEQARGLDQIGKAIAQMQGVGQTNAATAEESAAAAEELTAQSATLNHIGRRLQALVDGGGYVGVHD